MNVIGGDSEVLWARFGEVYRFDEVIGWNFRSVLRQQFNYAKYPFDREEVWIRMWSRDFDKNIILTPDLVSYHTTDPGSKPGLELQDFVLEDWDITETFFSYRDNTYETNFGIENGASACRKARTAETREHPEKPEPAPR